MIPRVLFVDDEPHILESLADVWGLDFEVATAIDGTTALATLDAWQPAIIVSDMRMPGMDGASFLAAARAKLPVAVRILLTGQADLEAAGRAVNAGGIFKLLTKPCPHELMRSALGEAAALHTQQARGVELATRLEQTEHLATLGSLSAVMEHEVNNAVSLLGCAIESVEEAVAAARVPDREVVEQLVQGRTRLLAQARGASALAHRASRHVEQMYLDHLLRSLVTAIRDAGLARRAEIVTDLDFGGTVVADRTELDQVMLNLIKNSLDALPHGRGRVAITTRRLGSRVEIVVEDTGVGIPPSDLGKVFEPFYTTKPPTVGTGLGLPVAKKIVQAYGGTIDLASKPGTGTRIRIELPAGEPSEG